jgi:parallel beta-helix repeat protein
MIRFPSRFASSLASMIILASFLSLTFGVQRVEASGTIYIRADGSVEGTSNIQTADNVTYVFTANINGSIVIQRDNITIDGNGYTLMGAGIGQGINLWERRNVTVQNATIEAFDYGIEPDNSSSNSIGGNNITANKNSGIYLIGPSSNNNSISGNNITDNYIGIRLYDSSSNSIYHNNFVNNTLQVYDIFYENPSIAPSINTWDDGYPSGGNYWSDYTGVDLKSGPYQNITGSDGIGDTSYVIDANNSDHYPFMTQVRVYPIPEFPSFLILPLLMIVTLLTVAIYKKRALNKRTY